MERETIFPARWDHRQNLTAGWSYPNANEAREDATRASVWMDSEHAEITFLLREVAPRTIRGQLVPFKAIGEEGTLSLQPSLNGDALPPLSLKRGSNTVALDLPVEAQRCGLNVLSLDFGGAWRVSDYNEDGGDLRKLSARSWGLSFVNENADVDRRRTEALFLAPGGVEAIAFGEEEVRDVAQLSGTILRYHLRIPPQARFEAHVKLAVRGPQAPEEVIFRLRAIGEGLVEEKRAEARVGNADVDQVLTMSLSSLAGKIVRLEFEVLDPAGSAEPLVGLWGRPVLLPDGVAETEEPPPAEETPALAAAREVLRQAPVVLVLLDACNPTFLSSYGGREGLTPNLSRIAAEGARFEEAYTQASYTISAVPSILTSTYTWDHGTWNNGTRMSESIGTWATCFDEAGYRTVGLIGSPNGSSIFGMERGFDDFRELFADLPEGQSVVLAEQMLQPLVETLQSDDERPLFLWMHIVEPHEPYSPPAPWSGSIVEDSSGTRLTGSADDLWAIRERRVQPTEEDLTYIRGQYEENLAYVDDVMGRVRERLDEAGIFEEAVVAIFSDHGEGFLLHDSKDYPGMGHAATVYDDMARIPLLVRLPSRIAAPNLVVDSVVTNMDILATVADLIGLPTSPDDSRGISFAPLLFGPETPARDTVVSHSIRRAGSGRFLPSLCLRWRQWKYIHTSGDVPELYDLGTDPDELHNVATEHEVLAGYLRQRLREESGFDLDAGGLNTGLSGQTEISDDLREKMRALGYAR